MELPTNGAMRFIVIKDTEMLKKGDILIQDKIKKYIYCAGNVCTTIWTIESHPDNFEVLE